MKMAMKMDVKSKWKESTKNRFRPGEKIHTHYLAIHWLKSWNTINHFSENEPLYLLSCKIIITVDESYIY